jgi:hypothetical protein
MYSAGVNAALAEFFGIADTEAGNIPQSNNILSEASNTLNTRNIPATSASNIPTGNIPSDIGNILLSRDNIPVRSDSNIPPKLVTYHLRAL